MAAACAVLIAVPLSAARAFYEPLQWQSFLATVLVGLSYGVAYVIVLEFFLPVALAAPTRPRFRFSQMLISFGFLALAILSGGWLNEAVQGLLGSATSQHWWVGGSIVVIVRLVRLQQENLERRLRLDQTRWRQRAAQSELSALRARVDPHFLFNSLNTAAGLIEEDAERAVVFLTRVAGLYHHIVQAGRLSEVLLKDELEAAESLLEIYSLRYEGRLAFTIDASQEARLLMVPSLCLQPLVENAVLHGLSAGPATEITVRIMADLAEGWLRIRVEDDGPGPGASQHAGAGSSLDDLAARLQLFRGARLSTGSLDSDALASEAGGFQALIEIREASLGGDP